MPLFSKEVEQNSIESGNKFTSEVINIIIIISSVSIIVGIIFSEPLVRVFASGFTGKTAELTVFFVKVTFAYALLTSVIGILEAYLQYKNIFLYPILVGYAQNAVVIIIMLVSFYYSYYLLAFGVLIGNTIRLVLLGSLSKKAGLKYKIRSAPTETARKIVAMSLPIFFGSSVNQINLFVDKTLASRLIEGSVAALNYANLIISLVTGLTVTILATIIYPKITQANATGNQERLNDVFSTGINIILIIVVPFSLGAMVFSKQVVQAIYERGAFDQSATALTSSALIYYAVGLTFLSLNTVFIQVYYAKYNTITPLISGIISVIVNIILMLILVRFLYLGGLALATSISYISNTILLYVLMKKKYPEIIIIKSKKKAVTIVLASFVSVGAALAFYKLSFSVITLPNIVILTLTVLLAGVVYLILLKAFKIDELSFIRSIFAKRADNSPLE
jgi:putative peptidoglycan lipid II flippase